MTNTFGVSVSIIQHFTYESVRMDSLVWDGVPPGHTIGAEFLPRIWTLPPPGRFVPERGKMEPIVLDSEFPAQTGKVDTRVPGNREFKLPWHTAVVPQSSR